MPLVPPAAPAGRFAAKAPTVPLLDGSRYRLQSDGILPLPASLGGTAGNSVGKATRVHSHNQNGPVPDRLFTKFIWVASKAQPFQAGGTAIIIGANDIFKPDHSPSPSSKSVKYFQEFSTLYQYYRVHSCKIHIQISSQQDDSAGGANPTWCLLLPTNDILNPGVPNSLEAALAWPNVKTRIV